MINEPEVRELLRLNGERLYHREGQELEFKEQFNLAALADYFRDFAAFSNNRGGHLIFGVKDAPRVLIGMSEKSADQFEKIDPEKITGFLLDIFSSEIHWDQAAIEIDDKKFGVFRVWPSNSKPVIARKDEGKDQTIKNGEIYYRYGGRTQKIQSAELESIINHRIEQNNQHWLDLMSKIGRAGPQNAAILDTEKGLIEKDETRVLVLDEGLASKLKFIKQGEFVEKDGATALQLVGDVVPIDQVEVIKHVKENLTKNYPLAAIDLADEVKGLVPGVGRNEVWKCITENDLKNNSDYSAYNFRNKKHEDEYRETGVVPSVTPSIYNHAAVEFLVKVMKTNRE
ncbi:ATP-binding protein [Halomonas sp. QX-2]|uniref:ATP-binding protein n=1 Tax=Vreelandella sedimenti TaxID=2729618 RepID=A0A7Z0N5W9_9GAMM|nr:MULTISPECIES: ATP-binding protein [Halomonas]NYT72223.1 ATP-binding protein [Halomonas sedimenti]